MSRKPLVLVTIPAYSEEKSIGEVVRNSRTVMKKGGYNYRIMVISDGSTDGTEKAARQAGAAVFSHPYHCGLAETFRTEMQKAIEMRADIIVHIDADGQYRAEEIPKLIEPIIKKNADLVLGSRFLGTIEYMPFMKKAGNMAFSRVISQITGVKIADSQTGFRAFTSEVAKKIVIKSTHTYTQEQIIKAVKNKFVIAEVPVYFGARAHGKSRLMKNPFSYAIKAWINILRIYRDFKPLAFFGSIGAGLSAIGLLIGMYFIHLQLKGVGVTGHQGLISLMLILIFTGIQIILFGFLADKDA